MKRLLYLLTIALTISIFSHSGNTAIVTDGLVSYWTFDRQDIVDNTAKDVWGKNDGTIVGNPKLVAGRRNSALEFDGFDDYVNLTNLGDFGSQVGTSTFEAWVKTSLKKERSTTLFKVRDADCGMGWGMDLNGWTERPRDPHIPGLDKEINLNDWQRANHNGWKDFANLPPILAMNPGVNLAFDNNISFNKDVIRLYLAYKSGQRGCRHSASGWRFPISDGEWHHLVYVNGVPYVDEDGRELRERAIFIDGKREWLSRYRIEETDSFIPFTEPVYLGAGNNLGEAEAFFNGIIDEVRIYDRPLTQDEVTQNFEIELSVEAAEKLPVVWGALKTAQ
ncbi:MAG: hypothetical protein OXH39_11730 [Candidatus Poribacteria bacterium]|nr:hypothetical protein [Candidatus Poribacteria bacterium]